MERCIVCGSELVPHSVNNAFYVCNGTKEEPHPDYLLSTKFISVNGTFERKEVPKEKDAKGIKTASEMV